MKIKKIGRPAPTWLKMLPTGEYTINNLIKITGKTKSTIRGVLNTHQVPYRYELKRKYIIAIYNWKGLHNE